MDDGPDLLAVVAFERILLDHHGLLLTLQMESVVAYFAFQQFGTLDESKEIRNENLVPRAKTRRGNRVKQTIVPILGGGCTWSISSISSIASSLRLVGTSYFAREGN